MVHNLAFHNISGGVFPVTYLANGTVLGGNLVGVARWVNWNLYLGCRLKLL